jgi:FRG domain
MNSDDKCSMKNIKFEYGISERRASNWNDFLVFINSNLQYRHFVWRGQSDSSWLLEPMLDRVLRKIGKTTDESLVAAHLRRFKYATRGRRGPHPPLMNDENEWWALGQHHGLATPLLDWTRSPFVAAYFALLPSQNSSTGERAVFGISQSTIEFVSHEIKSQHKSNGRPSIIEFVEPLSNENARLVNQNGLFSRSPISIDIEKWMTINFPQNDENVRLWKIVIPDKVREVALKSLNRMNLNHLSLFPDLYGASKFVNIDLEITDY